MRAKLAGLFWLASVAGAAAFDIENHARWVVLDDMPLLASGQPIRREVSSLRTVDIAAQPRLSARLRSHEADSRLRLGWTRRWSIRRIAARATIASETSGSVS